MKRIARLAVIAAALIASPAAAGIERAGTAAASFLAVGTGPSALAMGGAAIGRAGTLELAAWNAGSLGFLGETNFALAHAGLDDQVLQEWAAMGGRVGRSDTRWAMTTLYQSEGSFEGRDASNNSTGSFNVSSAAGTVLLAREFASCASVGIASKYVIDNLGPARRGGGFAFDAGLAMRFGMLGLGVAAQNVGGEMRYEGVGYPFPQNVGGGISLTHAPSGLAVACDVNVPSTSYTNVRAGVEWTYKQRVALRTGYRYELEAPADDGLTGPSFGTGLGARGVWLDYAFLLSGNDGGQHRLAITLRPGQTGLKPSDPLGQSTIPREFDDGPIGPPEPTKATKASKVTKKQ